jgi:spore germination protein KC
VILITALKRIALIFFTWFTVFFLSACWDRREMNSISYVLGVGLDPCTEKELELTLQVAKMEETSKSSQGRGGEGSSQESEDGKAFINLKAECGPIFSQVRKFNKQYGRKPFFQQNYAIIFNEEVARRGLKKYLDFFLRYHETRQNVWVLVSEGMARDILSIEPKFEKIPAVKIDKLIHNQVSLSASAGVKLIELVQKLENKDIDPLLTLVKKESGDQDEDIVTIEGMAVFKHDKYVGSIDKVATRGYLWAKGKVEGGIINASIDENSFCAVEIKKTSGKMKVKVGEDNTVSVSIKAKCTGDLGELKGFEGVGVKDVIKAAREGASKVIEDEIKAAFEKSAEYESDFLGIGDYIRRHDTKKWIEIKEGWYSMLPGVQLDVKAEVKIDEIGEINKLENPPS